MFPGVTGTVGSGSQTRTLAEVGRCARHRSSTRVKYNQNRFREFSFSKCNSRRGEQAICWQSNLFQSCSCWSAEADLVLLGLACPEKGKESEYAERLVELTEGLASCFLVHNGSLFIGELVTPTAEDESPEEKDRQTQNSPASPEDTADEPEKIDSVKLKADEGVKSSERTDPG